MDSHNRLRWCPRIIARDGGLALPLDTTDSHYRLRRWIRIVHGGGFASPTVVASHRPWWWLRVIHGNGFASSTVMHCHHPR
ncbi:hypothetical protein AVEN_36314-1 [Araneus ventricosus]|uniref:Uncharacterized protein n=1 Tax=Araneus ventricosus TaxID=182803 RepID=A0A4Y2GGG4_ARAVE|nr:hypothetical protein AVEN_36314-1 [Araneus ventricosus]